MEATVLVQSYDTFGGHPSISLIGALLEDSATAKDCGLAAFEATACFRTNRPPRRTLEELHSRFHAGLADLPKLRWERGKGRLSVRYESRLGLAEDVLVPGPPVSSILRSALDELVAVLRAREASLARKPGLDARRFVGVLASLGDIIPDTDAGLAALQREVSGRRQAEGALLPWWERLGIDWKDYHPSARRLLDDPFFWSDTDDYSPHGNDTGADLLAEFRVWRRSHRGSAVSDYVARLMRRWGLPMGWEETPMEQWGPGTDMALMAHDEAAIALAFALIKLEGTCPGSVRAEALKAIDRQGDTTVSARLGWRIGPDRTGALEKMRRVLALLPS